jgi:hypothetical protein
MNYLPSIACRTHPTPACLWYWVPAGMTIKLSSMLTHTQLGPHHTTGVQGGTFTYLLVGRAGGHGGIPGGCVGVGRVGADVQAAELGQACWWEEGGQEGKEETGESSGRGAGRRAGRVTTRTHVLQLKPTQCARCCIEKGDIVRVSADPQMNTSA